MPEKNHYALIGEPSTQNLEANQRGMLSAEQKSALEMVAKGHRSSFMFFGMIILAFVGFFVFFFWQVAGVEGLLSPTSLVTVGLVVLGVALLILVVSGPFAIIPRGEIEDGQVESVIGKVVWLFGRYTFISDSRKLKSPRNGRVLPPGDYRFYCLPRSGLVIVAEELKLSLVKQPKDLLLEALARAIHFSRDDLQVNRQGSLSGSQETRLLGYASLLGGFFLVFVWLTIFAYQSRMAEGNLLINIFLALMTMFVFLRLGWGGTKVILDIWGGEIMSMDGQVTKHIRRGRNTRYYLYQLGETKFRVSKSAYNALIEGGEYRVYFAPRSKRLVAIEPL